MHEKRFLHAPLVFLYVRCLLVQRKDDDKKKLISIILCGETAGKNAFWKQTQNGPFCKCSKVGMYIKNGTLQFIKIAYLSIYLAKSKIKNM